MSVTFKVWSTPLPRLAASDFMIYKDYKNWFKTCLYSMWNQLQDPAPHLFLYRSSCHHPSLYFYWSFSHASFLIVPSISPWSDIFWSLTCCFRSSFRHAMQMGVSEPKIISFYLVMMSLTVSSRSYFVFIQFRRGMFNFFASSHRDVLFIYY